MLSFGIDAAFAFSTAFWSARLPAGSGPPSFAATMIARVSFEKSFPRLASAAPFLCLIDDHLLCPDTALLPHDVQEPLVQTRVVGQLRMEGGDEEPSLARQHRMAGPSRARTGGPAPSPSTSTSGPASSSHGARIKTARSGSSPSPTSRSA